MNSQPIPAFCPAKGDGGKEQKMYPIDGGLYTRLAECASNDVCLRAGCTYEGRSQAYTLLAWGDVYRVFVHEHRLDCLRGPGPGPHSYFSVFLIHYLLDAPPAVAAPEWISEKDIPGGATFFRGPHQIPTHWIADKYGNDVEAFSRRCRQLGGELLSLADAAFSFRITARAAVAILYWQGDDDFPAEAKVLFDRSLAGYLAADVVFALAVDVCARLSAD